MPDSASSLRSRFPILARSEGGKPLRYLDSAATSQRPDLVTEAMRRFTEEDNGAVHRGMHPLAERATAAYEDARDAVRAFLGAEHRDEIVFTRGTTEAINLVARSFGTGLRAGDAVLVTALEHHSNIVPWQQLAAERGIVVRVLGVDVHGRIDLDGLVDALKELPVKLVALTGQSNVLGIRPPVRDVADLAHAAGARVLVDAAQLAAHAPIDVRSLGADFLAFSGHKVYGPTGIGALYGKRELLRDMPPFLGGGMMVREVTEEGFTPDDAPGKFEAGTPPVTEAVGLAAALRWLQGLDRTEIAQRETLLLRRLMESLSAVRGVRLLGPGPAGDVFSCVSFAVEGAHPHDVTELLGREGICLRAGHHCAQILHKRLGVGASARASLGLYTSQDDVDAVAPALAQALTFLHG